MERPTNPRKILNLVLELLKESSPGYFSVDVYTNEPNIFHIRNESGLFATSEEADPDPMDIFFETPKEVLNFVEGNSGITIIVLLSELNERGQFELYRCEEEDYCFKNYREDSLGKIKESWAARKIQTKFRKNKQRNSAALLIQGKYIERYFAPDKRGAVLAGERFKQRQSS